MHGIVVHLNNPGRCVTTVRMLLDHLSTVTVIDNASEPENIKALRDQLPATVTIIENAANSGWGGGLNVGLQAWLATSSHEGWVLVAAHDAILEELCVANLMKAIQQRSGEKIGLVCPQYAQRASIPVFSPIRAVRQRPLGPVLDTSTAVDVPHGTLILLNRRMLEEVGLFDERFLAYGEEYDLGLRAAKHGWVTILVNDALIHNPGTDTPSVLINYLYARNTLMLARDHGGRTAYWTRSLLIVVNNILLLVRQEGSSSHRLRSVGARLRGVRDAHLRRYGLPPNSVWSRVCLTRH